MPQTLLIIVLMLVTSLMLVLCGCNKTEVALPPPVPTQPLPAQPLSEALRKLSWLQHADSIKDARQAIADKDFRLLVIDRRGAVYPGVAKANLTKVKQHCKHRFAQGMSDIIVSAEHKKWLKKGRAYVAAYNQIMVKQCLIKKNH
jgi:hypothetical protein